MYRTSNDLRFVKNKEAMQRAFIDLTLEYGLDGVTVTQLAKRARVNRMTFYSHYDDMSDIVSEFTDDMVAEILDTVEKNEAVDVEEFLGIATELMRREYDFFSLIAKDDRYAFCRNEFRSAFRLLLERELEKAGTVRGERLGTLADMLASSITYAYLDWLAGKYEDVPLSTIIEVFKDLLASAVAAP